MKPVKKTDKKTDLTEPRTKKHPFWIWLHSWGVSKVFYQKAIKWERICGWLALILGVFGLAWGLWYATWECRQGGSYRILYIHAPVAWLSMSTYVAMAIFAAVGFIWRVKIAEMMALSAAVIGAWFTVAALLTGVLWGRVTWGAGWAWDARIISEAILLFLYLGYLGLHRAIEDPRQASRSSAILAVIGVINVPIIHFSVIWWNSIHQDASVTRFDKPAVHWTMLVPLLTMLVAAQLTMIYLLFQRTRGELLERESDARWAREVATS